MQEPADTIDSPYYGQLTPEQLEQRVHNVFEAYRTELATTPPTEQSLSIARRIGISIGYRMFTSGFNTSSSKPMQTVSNENSTVPAETANELHDAIKETHRSLHAQQAARLVPISLELGKTIDLEDPHGKNNPVDKLVSWISILDSATVTRTELSKTAPLLFGVDSVELSHGVLQGIRQRRLAQAGQYIHLAS